MPNIRISEYTYNRLVGLREGMETFNDVISNLIASRDRYVRKMIEEANARSTVEADRTKDR